MKAVFTILSILLFIPGTVVCQTVKLAWANVMHGNSYDACRAVVLDAENNIYWAGYYSTTVDFDVVPVYSTLHPPMPKYFPGQIDSAGKLIWARTIGDFRYQAIYAMTVDTANNIYTTGIYFGTTDFDPGPGVTELTSVGNEDIFVCKYDKHGNFIWARSFGGLTNDFCNSIITDRSGDVYFNGYFEGIADFDPGTGVYNLESAGSTMFLSVKFPASAILFRPNV